MRGRKEEGGQVYVVRRSGERVDDEVGLEDGKMYNQEGWEDRKVYGQERLTGRGEER